jgi:hypothetical protein
MEPKQKYIKKTLSTYMTISSVRRLQLKFDSNFSYTSNSIAGVRASGQPPLGSMGSPLVEQRKPVTFGS